MLAGKVYDFVSYSAQEPDETVFVSSTEPKIGMHPLILLFFVWISSCYYYMKDDNHSKVNMMATW